MFKIIRCGADFDLVIVVSPSDASPDAKDAKYYRYASWTIGYHLAGVFNEITGDIASGYFSGHADGLGWESLPTDIFPSLDAVLRHIVEKRKPILEKRQMSPDEMAKLIKKFCPDKYK